MLWKRRLASCWEAKWPFFHPSFPSFKQRLNLLMCKGSCKISWLLHNNQDLLCSLLHKDFLNDFDQKALFKFPLPHQAQQEPSVPWNTNQQWWANALWLSAALEGTGCLSLSELHSKDTSDNITSKKLWWAEIWVISMWLMILRWYGDWKKLAVI